MRTEYENCRYPPDVEMNMLEAGYKIVVNGKRLTKKEAAARLPVKKKR